MSLFPEKLEFSFKDIYSKCFYRFFSFKYLFRPNRKFFPCTSDESASTEDELPPTPPHQLKIRTQMITTKRPDGQTETGAAAQRVTATGPAATGAAAQRVTATGAAAQRVTATGAAAQRVTATGAAAQRFTATGPAATGAAAQRVTATGAAAQRDTATGVAAQRFTATGAAAQRVTTTGPAAQRVTATGAAAQRFATSDSAMFIKLLTLLEEVKETQRVHSNMLNALLKQHDEPLPEDPEGIVFPITTTEDLEAMNEKLQDPRLMSIVVSSCSEFTLLAGLIFLW